MEAWLLDAFGTRQAQHQFYDASSQASPSYSRTQYSHVSSHPYPAHNAIDPEIWLRAL